MIRSVAWFLIYNVPLYLWLVLTKRKAILSDARYYHTYQFGKPVSDILKANNIILFTLPPEKCERSLVVRKLIEDGYSKSALVPYECMKLSIWRFVATTFYSPATRTVIPNVKNRIQMFHGLTDKGPMLDHNFLPFNHMFLTGPLLYEKWKRYHRVKYYEVARYQSAYRVGYPYSDPVFNKGDNGRKKVFSKYGLDCKKPTILYAPTHNKNTSFDQAGPEIIAELSKIDGNILFRLHHLLLRRDHHKKNLRRFLSTVDNLEMSGVKIYDATYWEPDECFSVVDVLVNDISGIGFEYILGGKDVVYYDVPKHYKSVGNQGIDYWGRYGCLAGDPASLRLYVNNALNKSVNWGQKRLELSRDLAYNWGKAAEVSASLVQEIDNKGVVEKSCDLFRYVIWNADREGEPQFPVNSLDSASGTPVPEWEAFISDKKLKFELLHRRWLNAEQEVAAILSEKTATDPICVEEIDNVGEGSINGQISFESSIDAYDVRDSGLKDGEVAKIGGAGSFGFDVLFIDHEYSDDSTLNSQCLDLAVSRYLDDLSWLYSFAPNNKYGINLFWARSPVYPQDTVGKLLHLYYCAEKIRRALGGAARKQALKGKPIVAIATKLSVSDRSFFQRLSEDLGFDLKDYYPLPEKVFLSKKIFSPKEKERPKAGLLLAVERNSGRLYRWCVFTRYMLSRVLWSLLRGGDTYKLLKTIKDTEPTLYMAEIRPNDLSLATERSLADELSKQLKWRYSRVEAANLGNGKGRIPFFYYFSASSAVSLYTFKQAAKTYQNLLKGREGAIPLNLVGGRFSPIVSLFQAIKIKSSIKVLANTDSLGTERAYMASSAARNFNLMTIFHFCDIVSGSEVVFKSTSIRGVVHARSMMKDDRVWTAVARFHGQDVVWLVDRISGKRRLTNRPVESPHFSLDDLSLPSRIVLSDRVTQKSLESWGYPADRIALVPRVDSFGGLVPANTVDHLIREGPIRILLVFQLYIDNMVEFVDVISWAASKLAKEKPVILIVRPHPLCPISNRGLDWIKNKAKGCRVIRDEAERLDPNVADVFVTGYSTAALDALYAGKPVVWLSGIVLNSCFVEEFISNCGFSISSRVELYKLLREIIYDSPAVKEKVVEHKRYAHSVLN